MPPRSLPLSAEERGYAVTTARDDVEARAMVARAAEPSRTREPDHSTPEELRAAAAKPLGTQTFRLQNLEDLTAVHPDALKGQKVQVKGVLIRQPNNDRINVASLETVAAACSATGR